MNGRNSHPVGKAVAVAMFVLALVACADEGASGPPEPPAPPQTPMPASTAPLLPRTSTPGPAGTVLRDNFDVPAQGILPKQDENARYVLGYADGEYVIAGIAPEAGGTHFAAVPGTWGDAAVAVDARLTGDPRHLRLTLGCRWDLDSKSGYQLSLLPSLGMLNIERYDNGTVGDFEWGSAEVVLRRRSTINRLELHCAGDSIAASINGSVVARFTDTTYREGVLWLGAGNLGTRQLPFTEISHIKPD